MKSSLFKGYKSRSSSESNLKRLENTDNSMSWGNKFYDGSMWIVEKTREIKTDIFWGFADWDSMHSHRVVLPNGRVVYNRVISGIDLLFM